jgi:hypothetical protein
MDGFQAIVPFFQQKNARLEIPMRLGFAASGPAEHTLKRSNSHASCIQTTATNKMHAFSPNVFNPIGFRKTCTTHL